VPAPLLQYDPVLERAITRVASAIATRCPHPRLAARGLAILAIGRDPEVEAWLTRQAGGDAVREALVELTAAVGRDSVPARLARERSGAVEALARTVSRQAEVHDRTLSRFAARLAVHPVWGWPMLLGVLYLVYLFVGDFGAGVLVGLLEEDLFGGVLGMLGGISFAATLIWVASTVGVLLATGWLASKVVPGRRVPLVTELPPMRRPVLGNVLKKTGGRLKWYLLEVIPIFLAGTLLMFVLDRTGVLPWIVDAGRPLVAGWLGLPPEASAAFVMGFLRRDFGASGLFALQREQLHAYGLSAPHPVKVLQQQPMTVILCDHVELALEHEVARHIWVEAG